MYHAQKVFIRGAGELASATGHILHRAGFPVVMSDLAEPRAIRRTVSFCDAIYTGETEVEGTRAVKGEVEEIPAILERGCIALVIDSPEHPHILKPDIFIDARMLKKPVKGLRVHAPFTIGLGPGFDAGRDCDAVIETQRGHDLGRIIWEGPAKPPTGIPGMIAGETVRRVLYAPAAGTIRWTVEIGDLVTADDVIGRIGSSHQIRAPLSGLVRGLISPLAPVPKGLKIADVDPRGREVDHRTISDKARAVGRGALEAVLIHLHNPDIQNSRRDQR